MIKLSKYRAYSQKKKTTYSTRCIARIIVWKQGRVSDSYIGHLAIYDDESIRCMRKYPDDAAGIGLIRAQQELDDYADSRRFRYSGCNSKLPIYDRYSYGGLCLLTE